MYHIPTVKVQLVRDGATATEKKRCATPADSAALLRTYLAGADREHFVVLLLNVKHGVIGINTIAVGTLCAAPVHPREVFKAAILANAYSIIVGHNHPSDDPAPSQADDIVTKRLVEAGTLLGIPVVDHIIITEDTEDFFSYLTAGRLPQ